MIIEKSKSLHFCSLSHCCSSVSFCNILSADYLQWMDYDFAGLVTGYTYYSGRISDFMFVFRSGRISSVYIVSKWVVVTLLSKLVNFECVGMLECVGVFVCCSVGMC